MNNQFEPFPKIRLQTYFKLLLLVFFDVLFDPLPKKLIRDVFRYIDKGINHSFSDTA